MNLLILKQLIWLRFKTWEPELFKDLHYAYLKIRVFEINSEWYTVASFLCDYNKNVECYGIGVTKITPSLMDMIQTIYVSDKMFLDHFKK